MAGISFLRDRSPVTPKITMPDGPAIRGSRLSRGSRSGFVVDRHGVLRIPFVGAAHGQLDGRRRGATGDAARDAGHRCASLRAAATLGQCLATVSTSSSQDDDELVDALGLQHLEDVVEVDADGGQIGEHLRGLARRCRATVSPRITPWSATASIVFSGAVLTVFGRDQLDDVTGVVVRRVLDPGGRPQRTLLVAAGGGQCRPTRALANFCSYSW